MFAFLGETFDFDVNADFVARLPKGLNSRDMLFDALRRELHLPDYFGVNWDALADCLRDLGWIRRRRVVLLHEDLPRLDEKTLTAYLEVLADCVRDWKPGEQHELVVVFPRLARDAVSRLGARRG